MFVNARNEVVFYALWDKAIARKTLWGNYEKITGDNVKVESFEIILKGNEKNDGYPPRITISISVSPQSEIEYLSNIFSRVQMTVSSRSLDT